MTRRRSDDQRTILLTGGTGFLGGHLLNRLVRNGHSVILLKRSFSDTRRLDSFRNNLIFYDIDTTPLEQPFQENSISSIIHCAAEQAKKDTDPERFLKANVLFPVALLQLGRKYQIQTFINTDTILNRKVNAYALSKHQFREWFKTYADCMTCINISPELIYGPDDRKTSFVSFIVREFLRDAESIDLTPGEQKRDFVYIDDVVDVFILLLEHSMLLKSGYYDYQIGTNNALTIKEIVNLIKSLTGNNRTRLNFGSLQYREHELMESRIDNSGLYELGWIPKYSLEDGLRATIEAERTRMDSR